MADEREVTLPGELSVLTWGSDIYENPYWDPIRKKLQGSNLGHGAFLLNLPETPENKAAFERLMALGYPAFFFGDPLFWRQASLYFPYRFAF